jgi:ABC-type sugar transport system ATPase subunit
MIRLMIGRDLKALYTAARRRGHGNPRSKTSARTYPDCAVNFSLRRGEIVGWRDWSGPADPNWRAPFSELTGRSADRWRRGRADDPVASAMRSRAGIYLIPEDRKRPG